MSEILSVQNLSHHYDQDLVFSNLSLSVKKGEWLALLGGSGCGKSTLLRCISGLIKPSGGSIFIEGVNITHTPANQRGVGLVFQDYALFPTCTVRENIEFGRKNSAPSCTDLLKLISLKGMEHRFPAQLSGGQQQRVALARALAAQPKILLLDEPFANIDAFKKNALISELRMLLQGVSVIFVTHDRSDAMAIADRIAVFDGRSIAQISEPEDLYTHPKTLGIAEKTGICNILEGEGSRTDISTALGVIQTQTELSKGRHTLLVRPEDFECIPNTEGSGTILQRSYIGGRYRYTVMQNQVEITIYSTTKIPTHTAVHIHQRQPLWVIPPNKEHK
jgi:ABC-type Fe3+/spermidine/putrescine transport system ATPase subunit